MDKKTDNLIEPDATMLSYDRYLKVQELLGIQLVQSNPAEHDETLFIIIHQVYELWFKQILHELEKCQSDLKSDLLVSAIRSLRRVEAIQNVLIDQVDILETMTPNDFNRFRGRLNPASGFQSHQFRRLEFRLGMKEAFYLRFFRSDPEVQKLLEDDLNQPSLWDCFLKYLKRRNFDIPEQPASDPIKVIETLASIYEDPEACHDIYLACEALVTVDEKLMIWRYRHVAMVNRMIGDMGGTGGSEGARYLEKTLSKRAFPELWKLRNHLGQKYS
jgi:tryptophan 2,3-dioxygenase